MRIFEVLCRVGLLAVVVVGQTPTQTPWPGISGPIVLSTPQPAPPSPKNITFWLTGGDLYDIKGGVPAVGARLEELVAGVDFSCTHVCGTDSGVGEWLCTECAWKNDTSDQAINGSQYYTVGYQAQATNYSVYFELVVLINTSYSDLSLLFQSTVLNVSVDPEASTPSSSNSFPITNTLLVAIALGGCILIFGLVALVLMIITPQPGEIEEDEE
eukprot:TRINITY_DN9031_c0_g1_i1.p1 TRINITY_DN9031_c0_g1~~TRINITY_DN9031_c0_g1_i1.p1  ORF type:complete len:214 (+),score=28.94 TRINITY_DN9031_c0_g1_i1:49-690(+)